MRLYKRKRTVLIIVVIEFSSGERDSFDDSCQTDRFIPEDSIDKAFTQQSGTFKRNNCLPSTGISISTYLERLRKVVRQ